MDLKEYILIIKNNFKVFLFIVVLITVSGLVYFPSQPVSYDASLALNITRQGSQQTNEYKYDQYYRLGADEKFCETIVEWLKDPGIVKNIFSQSKIYSNNLSLRKITKLLKPEKMSSQLVIVHFSAINEELAKNISDNIKKEVKRNTDNLNSSQNEENWFEVVGQDPVIIKHSFNLWVIFLVFTAIGLFTAFWTILILHYFKDFSKK